MVSKTSYGRAARHYGLYVAILALGTVLHLAAIDSLPAGLNSDEAFHMLRAQDIVNGIALPRYITSNQGNEPLMAYLTAVAIAILGPVPWASRLVSALASIVALAATLRIGREMAPGRWVALGAGLLWCTLGWALTVGRLGTQPMLAVMAVAVSMAGLWAGLRSGNLWHYALSGLGLGLGLDAYVAFRLFPIVPAVTLAAAWVSAPAVRRRSIIRGGLALILVSAAVYAPVASFFVQYPEWFLNRFNNVTESTLGSTSLLTTLTDGWSRSIGGLFLTGDLNARHNIPGRPGLDLAQLALFAIGLLIVTARWRGPMAISFLAWLVVTIAPGALTDSAPHFLRMAGATPAIALIIGFGVDALLNPLRIRRWVGLGLAAAWLASSALTTWLIFTQWMTTYDGSAQFDQPSRWIGERLHETPVGTRLYLSPITHENYTLEYLLGPERYAALSSFEGRACTVFPEETGALPARYAVYTGHDTLTEPVLRSLYPSTRVIAESVESGAVPITIYQLPPHTAAAPPDHSLDLRFSGQLDLRGWALSIRESSPGGTVSLETRWLAVTAPTGTWVLFAHLRLNNIVFAQRDAEPCGGSYPTSRWRTGEGVIERTVITVPDTLPIGTYQIYVGWYDRETLARLTITDPTGARRGDEVFLTEISIR